MAYSAPKASIPKAPTIPTAIPKNNFAAGTTVTKQSMPAVKSLVNLGMPKVKDAAYSKTAVQSPGKGLVTPTIIPMPKVKG